MPTIVGSGQAGSRTARNEPESDLSKFWKDMADKKAADPQAHAYDWKIFDKEDVSFDDLAKHDDAIRAAQLVYKWDDNPDAADPLLQPIDKLTDEQRRELLEQATEATSWYNNNIGYTVANGISISNASAEQKEAFLYMLNIHEKRETTWGDFGRFVYQGLLLDPTNIAMLFTFGGSKVASTAAQVAAKEGVQLAVKEGVEEAVEQAAKTGLKSALTKNTATIIGAQGAAYGVGDYELKTRTEADIVQNAMELDPETAGRGAGPSWSGRALSGGLGFGMGFGLTKGGQWLSSKFAKSAGGVVDDLGDNVAAKIDDIVLDEAEIAQEVARLSNLPGRAGLDAENRAAAEQNLRLMKEFGFSQDDINKRAGEIWEAEGRIDDGGQSMFNHNNQAALDLAAEAEEKAAQYIHTPNNASARTVNSGDASGKIIPLPYETRLHKILKYDIFQRINEKLTFHKDGVDQAYKNIPIRLFSHKFIDPVINHVDDAVKKSGIIQPIKDLDSALLALRIRMTQSGSEQDRKVIAQEANELVRAFASDHGEKFEILQESLKPLRKEISEYKAVSMGEGLAGLDQQQKNTLGKWVDHLNRMCESAKSPDAFVEQYNINRQMFVNAGKEAPGISGGMQHYTKLAAEAELRLETRDRTKWDPNFKDKWRTKLKDAEGLKILDENGQPILDENGKPKDAKTLLIREAKAKDENGKDISLGLIEDGEDGVLAGGKYNRYKFAIENIDAHKRALIDGYYNDRIRVGTVLNNPDGPDNVENYAIRLAGFAQEFSDPKTGKLINDPELPTKCAELLYQGYTSGREGDVLNALRRLMWSQGPSGGKVTVPSGLVNKLKVLGEAENLQNDLHFQEFLDNVRQAVIIRHAPKLYGPRHMDQIAEKYTRWIFNGRLAPGDDIVGTPGKNHFYTTPIAYAWKHTWAKISGGKAIDNVDAEGKVIPTKPIKISYNWLWWGKPADEKASRFGVKNLFTNAPFYLQAPINWVSAPLWIPVKAVQATWKYAAKPALGHTAKTGVLLASVPLGMHLAEEGIEHLAGDDSNIDAGSRIFSGGLWVADKTVGSGIRLIPYMDDVHLNGGWQTRGIWGDRGEDKKPDEVVKQKDQKPDSAKVTPVNGTGTTPPAASGENGGNVMILQGEEERKSSDAAQNDQQHTGGTENGAGGTTQEQQQQQQQQHGAGENPYANESFSGIARDGMKAFSDMTAVDSDDPVTETFNRSVAAAGNALGSAWDWAVDTFKGAQRSKSGQAWLGIGGGVAGGFLANLIGMQLFKKIGIGDWPIVGTILSIGLFIMGFMGGRKMTHGMLPEIVQGNGKHVAADQDGARKVQSHDGGLPETKVLFKDAKDQYAFDELRLVQDKNGQWAVQGNSDSDTTKFVDLKLLNPGAVDELGKYRNRSHLPRDVINSFQSDIDNLRIEMVEHIPSEAHVVTIGKDRHLVIPKDMSPTPGGP